MAPGSDRAAMTTYSSEVNAAMDRPGILQVVRVDAVPCCCFRKSGFEVAAEIEGERTAAAGVRSRQTRMILGFLASGQRLGDDLPDVGWMCAGRRKDVPHLSAFCMISCCAFGLP